MGNWKIIIPEATTNLIINPNFEKDTTGWAKDGSNTIAQTSDESFIGNYGLKCTYQDDLDLARYAITLTAAAHAFGCWVYLPTNWDGGAVRLAVENFTGVTIDTATTTTTTTGQWVYLEILFTPNSGDLTGDLVIEAVTAPTAGRFIYVDACQCEAKAYSTTYCDGDHGGGEWDGARCASTSTRKVTTRAGGRVKDFADDFGFPIEKVMGLGMPDLDNIVTERTFTPGAEFQRFIVPERTLTLVSTLFGTSMSDFHAKRQALIKAIAPDGSTDSEPVILRYTGAAVTKEIRARYAGGLKLRGPSGFTESIGLQFIAEQPLFTQLGEKSVALTSKESHTLNMFAARIDGVWSDFGQDETTDNVVDAIVIDNDGKVYVGGSFVNWDNIANADGIAYWDGSSWNAMGTGMVGTAVRAIKVMPNGDILAGGDFTTMGGVTCNGIARWNGTAWSALGPPTNGGNVYCIEIDNVGDIYVGGSFTDFDGGTNQDGIVKWDTSASAWVDVSTGLAGGFAAAYAMKLDPAGNLIVAGDFTTAGGVSAANIALWDGTAFTALSTSTDDHVEALLFDRVGILYLGGGFNTIGGDSIDYLCSWNGVSFSEIGPPDSGPNEIEDWMGQLVVGGPFTLVEGMGAASSRLVIWNGSSWSYIDQTFTENVRAIASNGSDLYVGFVNCMTADGTATLDVTPAGTARVYPKLIIKRSGGTSAFVQNLGNETTGRYIWMNYNLHDGETITIDFNPEKITAVSDYRGDITPFLPNSALSDFFLLPNVANTITFYVSDAGSPTITAFLVWQDAYWSID